MTKRNYTVFTIAALAWTTAVALFGFFNMPKTVLPYAQAHAPAFIYFIIDIWLVVPAGVLLFLFGRTPAARALRRRINRGRETPPDREKWSMRVGVVTILFMVFGQAWTTLGLVLLWHKRELPWVAQVMSGPHWAGLPDPHHLIPRLWVAAGGLLLAWVGNSLPKLLNPFRGAPEPYDWTRMMRTVGWMMTLGGLGGAACGLFVTGLRAAMLTSCVVLMAPALAVLPIWAIYRFSGGHCGVIPPEGL